MCPVLPLKCLRLAQQAQPRLVDERGRLQSLVAEPPPQIGLGNRVQLPVDSRRKLSERSLVPLTPLSQQAGDGRRLFYKSYSVINRIFPNWPPTVRQRRLDRLA